jgi:glucosyl-3-phosphoglycerate synthase
MTLQSSSRRDFHFREFSRSEDLVRKKEQLGATTSIVIPARNEETTIGAIVESIRSTCMDRVPLVDELVVIDSESGDGTARAASAAGASVYCLSGPPVPHGCHGKGTALWKAQFVTRGDIVVFIDADISEFDPLVVAGLIGPLLMDPDIFFVKAYYSRPLIMGEQRYDQNGGRVTELLVKPLLRALVPRLAAVRQPLGGEYAFRREILEQLPFATGYGVEIGLLLDFHARYGFDHLAQVDIDTRIHRNRSLPELGAEATHIARTLLRKLERHGYISIHHEQTLDGIWSGRDHGSCESELAPRADITIGVER